MVRGAKILIFRGPESENIDFWRSGGRGRRGGVMNSGPLRGTKEQRNGGREELEVQGLKILIFRGPGGGRFLGWAPISGPLRGTKVQWVRRYMWISR